MFVSILPGLLKPTLYCVNVIKTFFAIRSILYYSLLLRAKRINISLRSFCKNCRFESYAAVVGKARLFDCSIGRFTFVNSSTLWNCDVGSFCSIAPDSLLGCSSHPLDRISTSPAFYRKQHIISTLTHVDTYDDYPAKTFIGHDVWVGSRAIILPGLRIGNGAVIGAGSVVTKNVDPYAVIGGVPARIIKHRFPKDIIEKLELLKWWEKDIEFLVDNISLFSLDVHRRLAIELIHEAIKQTSEI